jgi:hypothetical protein
MQSLRLFESQRSMSLGRESRFGHRRANEKGTKKNAFQTIAAHRHPLPNAVSVSREEENLSTHLSGV